MKEPILFVHGMFQNDRSWEKWVEFFNERGHLCIVESWPLHEGDPASLRKNPPIGLGDLRLQTVIDHYIDIIKSLDTEPIVIGHSVGGLIVQKLTESSLCKAGITISSVAPNKMLAFDWGFFRNSVQIANPLAGDSVFEMTAEGFHKNFANTLSESESNNAYEQYATHDSRNILRDCMLETGTIDLTQPHAPLLFIAAQMDQIIPPQLCEKNCEAYEDRKSIADYIMFPKRGHFICGEPGWEEIASYSAGWIDSLDPSSRQNGLLTPDKIDKEMAAFKAGLGVN